MKNTTAFMLLLCAISSLAAEDEIAARRTLNRKAVSEINSEWKKLADANEDMLALPGLLADRKAKKITALAESSVVKGKDIVEFFLIGESSGHDYEATAISFAKAADLKKALEFIGLEAGSCVNYRQNRFWPKGEPVRVKMGRRGDEKNLIAVEKYVIDNRTGAPLREEGFIFTGSFPVSDATNTMLAADGKEPQSYISNYNDPITLLDVPYQANQDLVYDHLHANAEVQPPTATLLDVVFEPVFMDGTKAVVNLDLNVVPDAANPGAITNFTFTLTGPDKKPAAADGSLKAVLDTINDLNRKKKNIYLSLSLDNDMQVGSAWQVCQLLQSLEASGSIRIEPPPSGQLYYRAFIPNPGYLDRNSRPGHPWEIRLVKAGESVSGTLTQCEFVWDEDSSGSPAVKASDYQVGSPEKLRARIEEINRDRVAQDKEPNIGVMLVVVPGEMPVGDVLSFAIPAIDLVPMVHVYAQDNVPGEKGKETDEAAE